MRTKIELYNDLEAILTKEEFEPVKKKIKKYLTIYAGVEFESFSVTVSSKCKVESIKFYNDKLNNKYRLITFDNYGEIKSIIHFDDKIKIASICQAVIDSINE